MHEPKRIDARYKKNYRTSFIENLTFIERYSLAQIDTFLATARKRCLVTIDLPVVL
jgi:hypothetical protein